MSDTVLAAPGREDRARSEDPRALRLRRMVRSRSLAGHGVAISAGHTAVVVDGAAAESLWAAVESTLRQGCTLEGVRERLPGPARDAMTQIWGQLVDHDLLCTASPPAATPSPLVEHFERTAADPARAVERAQRATAVIVGDPVLGEAIRDALGDTDIRTMHAPESQNGERRVIGDAMATLHLDVAASPTERVRAHAIMAIRVGGWRLVGRRPDLPGEVDALSAWADRVRDGASGPIDGDLVSGRGKLADALAGSQVVLEALRLIGQERPEPNASYLVTTPDVVAEACGLPLLPSARLDGTPIDLGAEALDPGEGPSIDDVLRRLEPLWDGPLARWSGPVPGNLPQLPIGLATAADGPEKVLGIGLSTAEARLSCVEQLAEAELGMPVGRDPIRATAQAVVAWATAPGRGEGKGAVVTPDSSAFTRRLTQALALREGVEVRVHASVAASGLVRVEVRAEDHSLLGTGLGVSSVGAHEEALLAALGTVLGAAARSVRSPAATVRVRTETVARELVTWAREQDLQVQRPVAQADWAGIGLHPRLVVDGTAGKGR